MVIYNNLLYRVVECTAEDGNFTIISYLKKISDNYCPRTTHTDYDNDYITNSKGVKISKEELIYYINIIVYPKLIVWTLRP